MNPYIDKILEDFENLNTIPRCSGNETGVCDWLIAWAENQGFTYQTDTAGNLVVQVPASPGYESSPVLVIQGHMDMVCEKTPASEHDFTRDPIVSHREGDWLTAGDTTLGADNGIAIAYALALAEADDIDRPPLELLFTVDEETGLNGVKELKSGFIKGRTVINLDSEDEGVATIGCAGGLDSVLTLDLETARLSPASHLCRLVVGGLMGGHSGIDIHKQRGNANKMLGRILSEVSRNSVIQLVSLTGGTRKNAIPRDASAILSVDPSQVEELTTTVGQVESLLKKELAADDEGLFVKVTEGDGSEPGSVLSIAATEKVIDVLMALPNGVAGMSTALEGLVETSCNLATVELQDGKLSILSSQRSAIMSRLNAITAEVHAVGRLCGADVSNRDGYPSWQPDMDSPVLHRSRQVYRQLYDQDLVIQVIHAGLECAIIGDIYPGTDLISFGPTIRNPHSPDEKIHIPSIEKVWDFLVALLKAMKD